jgi:hypothetical protein
MNEQPDSQHPRAQRLLPGIVIGGVRVSQPSKVINNSAKPVWSEPTRKLPTQ